MSALKGLCFAMAMAAAAVPLFAAAADFPSRPVTMIVPFPPGGASDIAGRIVAKEAEAILKQPIIVENRSGATGNIGARAVASAAPDGYTILCAALSVWSINPALFKSLPYDPAKDFDHLTVAVRTPNVLAVRKDFPAKDLKEFIAYMKANPGEVTFATSGSGSSDHLTSELFWQTTETKGVHVPYKGGGPAIGDLVAGQVDVSFANLGTIYPNISTGKVRAIAITSDVRHPQLPDVPTLKEQAVDEVVYSWQALGAPKGLPADVRAKLQEAVIGALNKQSVKDQFAKTGFEVVANTPEQFATFQAGEIARWKEVVAKGKIEAPN